MLIFDFIQPSLKIALFFGFFRGSVLVCPFVVGGFKISPVAAFLGFRVYFFGLWSFRLNLGRLLRRLVPSVVLWGFWLLLWCLAASVAALRSFGPGFPVWFLGVVVVSVLAVLPSWLLGIICPL